jgi:hypothetical protein
MFRGLNYGNPARPAIKRWFGAFEDEAMASDNDLGRGECQVTPEADVQPCHFRQCLDAAILKRCTSA